MKFEGFSYIDVTMRFTLIRTINVCLGALTVAAILAATPACAQYVSAQGGPRSQTQQGIANWCAYYARIPPREGNATPLGWEEAQARYRICKIRNRIN